MTWVQIASLPEDQLTYVGGAGEALPFPYDHFALVMSTNCLDHTEDPAAVVGEMVRVLQPGGVLWLTCEVAEQGEVRNDGHPHRLDVAALRSMLGGVEVQALEVAPFRAALAFLEGRTAFPHREVRVVGRKVG